MITPSRHVLLDIEGTTCPVRFVSETLFPYAAERMQAFLEMRAEEPTVQALLRQVEQAWLADPDPAAQALLASQRPSNSHSIATVPYLQWLIQTDRKLTPLKELQGLIWEAGYACGDLQAPLYPDVAPALRRWREAGLGLAVYSSGSVNAQQLLYGHSNDGDLRHLFQYWFDTKIGSKVAAKSYQCILKQLGAEGCDVLFISDTPTELIAARQSGLSVLRCERGEPSTPSSSDRGDATPSHSEDIMAVEHFNDFNPCAFLSDRQNNAPATPPPED